MGVGERKSEIRQSSRIGCRRIEEIRILSFPSNVARERIRAADTRRPAGLRNLLSGGCAEKRACADSCAGQKITSGCGVHHVPPL
jgi:hypothetical protein